MLLLYRPVSRNKLDIQQLSQHLKFFSHLFPIEDSTIVMEDFLTGLATRATLEELHAGDDTCKFKRRCISIFTMTIP